MTTDKPTQDLSARLPDGRDFPMWEDETEYSRVLYVAQAHPNASDENPGTEDRPFETVNRAAQVLQPGEKVVVKTGVYRERISPVNGGTGPDGMIAYEVAPGHRVVVRGSRIVTEEWQRSTDPEGEDFSFRLWQVALSRDLFPYEDRPFATPNASNAEIDLMPWALRWKDRIPYTLPRGLIFQNGRRMTQLATYEDLVRLPGSYWVDPNYCVVHIHPFDGVDPNQALFEVTVQEQLFRPATKGLGYIRVSGFIFEHAGNGFPRVGVGAVYVHGGHHWIISDNVVRQCNSVGIEAGARVSEQRVASEEENVRVDEHPGGFIIRDNDVYECGTGGIEGHTVRDTLVQGNRISQIGWQDVERYWECAGIKMLVNEQTLVRRNLIYDIESASGIWLDWDNRNCRITQNVVVDVQDAHNGAVFIEASQVPNWIDHNVIWGAWESGVNLFDTDETLVCHNLIAYAGAPVVSRVNTDRSLQGRRLTSKSNQIVNNIFYRNGTLPVIEDADNVCDHNVYGAHESFPTMSGRPNPDWDADSDVMALDIDLFPEDWNLWFATVEPLPTVEAVDASACDLFGRPASGDRIRPGPIDEAFGGGVVFRLCRQIAFSGAV
ncbi:MAG: right-handed parallel beta-helix repeat-containing protein [Anaerolineae bacterium]